MTEMPHASASLIPDHDDSGTYVNHDKDFAPPPKKLKGEEEDNTPTVVPMSQDSVEENDKDFAKLKGEEEEEDNTPVVPMSQDSDEEEDNSSVPKSQDSVEENDKDFAKLKGEEEEDHTPVVPMSQDSDSDEEEKPPFTEDEAREAFDLWRQMLKVEYADHIEYEKRFKFFKDSLSRKVHCCWGRYGMNILSLADRSSEEIHASGDYCDISIRRIRDCYEREFKAW